MVALPVTVLLRLFGEPEKVLPTPVAVKNGMPPIVIRFKPFKPGLFSMNRL